MKTKTLFVACLLFLSNIAFSQTDVPDFVVYGVTVDDVSISGVETSLSNLPFRPVTRMLLDPDENDLYTPNPSDYEDVVTSYQSVSNVMASPFDSHWWNYDEEYYFTPEDVLYRFQEFIDYSKFEGNVNIIEIGNEINGEWLYQGNASDVRETVVDIFDYNNGKYQTALTLFYYPPGHVPSSQYEMFNWANQLPTYVKEGLTWVMVSYYEDEFGGYWPDSAEWNSIFDSLGVIFPNSYLCIGESGPVDNNVSDSIKVEMIRKFYSLKRNVITQTRYKGGFFWWYFAEDCVPFSTNNWIYVNLATEMANFEPQFRPSNSNLTIQNREKLSFSNYPNPFNPSTTISYNIPKEGKVSLKIYNGLGQLIQILADEIKSAGIHTATFDGSKLSSGIYYYRIEYDGIVETKKISLIK